MLTGTWKKLKDFFNELGHSPYRPHPEVQKALEKKGYRFEEEFTPFPRSTPNFTTYIYRGGSTPITSEESTLQAYLKDYGRALYEHRAKSAGMENILNSGAPKSPGPR